MTRTESAIRGVFNKGTDLTVHRSCNPNRLGIIGLVEVRGDNAGWVVVQEEVYEGMTEDWQSWDYDSLEQATRAYEALVADASNTPNWELQAEYDEAHGTINGEDPGIVAMREMGY